MSRKKLSERLIERLIAGGHLAPGDYRIMRTYSGVWQRRAGAFSWYVIDHTGRDQFIGSVWNVRDVLSFPSWEFGAYGSIMPGEVADRLPSPGIHREPTDSTNGATT